METKEHDGLMWLAREIGLDEIQPRRNDTMAEIITYKTWSDADPLLRISIEQEEILRAAKCWPLKGRTDKNYSIVHTDKHLGLPTFSGFDIARIVAGEHPVIQVFDKQRVKDWIRSQVPKLP